jgi:hypothetical protein
MRQNCIQSKNARSLLLLTEFMARFLPLAALAFGLDPKARSRSGISMVRVARQLSLLLLQNKGATSVDDIGHRRLCFAPRLFFPNKPATPAKIY